MSGRLQHSPARVVQQMLVDLGLAAAPATPPAAHPEWACFYDSLPSSPDKVVVVTDTQGVPHRNDGFGNRTVYHGIQIRVRAGTHDPGWNRANLIATTLDDTRNPVGVEVEGVNYCCAFVKLTGDVLRMGPEQNSTRRSFSINALVHVLAM
jgi:hypothetical protein